MTTTYRTTIKTRRRWQRYRTVAVIERPTMDEARDATIEALRGLDRRGTVSVDIRNVRVDTDGRPSLPTTPDGWHNAAITR